MPTLFAALAAIYTTAAQCAAALGITRQAYSQAQQRQHLSTRATLRAAALLGIDPAAALLRNATWQNIPTPILNPAPDTTAHPQGEKKPLPNHESGIEHNVPITNYAQLAEPKKSASIGTMRKIVHVIPQTEKRLFEIDCVKWMLCVPRISPDSPRFVQYFSRWVVPEKIKRSKADGTFDEIVKNCPIFSPHLLDFIPAGIDEYLIFTGQTKKQIELDPPTSLIVNILTAAA